MRQQVDIAHRKADTEKTPEAVDLARKMIAQANQIELEVYAARAARHPQDLTYQYELAMRLKRAGKHREAVPHFQHARGDDKRLAETHLQLGECFQHIEQYRLAMTSYQAAIEAAEGRDDTLFRLALYRAGVLATGLKDLDAAEKFLTRLADLDFGYRDVADRLDKLAQMRNT
jgi:tetratricopeptide (TPR) repeat protein